MLLQTRRGALLQDAFPDLVAAAGQLPYGLVLDGEVVVGDPRAGEARGPVLRGIAAAGRRTRRTRRTGRTRLRRAPVGLRRRLRHPPGRRRHRTAGPALLGAKAPPRGPVRRPRPDRLVDPVSDDRRPCRRPGVARSPDGRARSRRRRGQGHVPAPQTPGPRLDEGPPPRLGRPPARDRPHRPPAPGSVLGGRRAPGPGRPGHPWEGVRFASAWGTRDVLDVTVVRPEFAAEVSADTSIDRGGIFRHPMRFQRRAWIWRLGTCRPSGPGESPWASPARSSRPRPGSESRPAVGGGSSSQDVLGAEGTHANELPQGDPRSPRPRLAGHRPRGLGWQRRLGVAGHHGQRPRRW
ncbi:hypothetical protein SAVIM338S_00064 [Streptomyces avidinii]